MQLKEGSIKVSGILRIYKNMSDGSRKLLVEKKNLTVDTGLELIADRMKANDESFLSHIAVGTDATAVTSSDTTLGAEIDRNAVTNATATDNILTIETVFTDSEANATWEEIALFNDPTTGFMYNRINVTFDKTPVDSVTVQFELTYERA